MATLISIEEARKILSESESRKDYIIEKMNAEIKTQAEQGKKWAPFPDGLSYLEKEWIVCELVRSGYTIINSNTGCSW